MSLSLDLAKFAAKAGGNADKVVRKVCLDLTRDVVLGTPVDTGRARANWFASLDAPSGRTIEYDKDSGSNIKAPDESAGSEFAVANAQDVAFKASGHVFYLTNNLPYIYRLEYMGWSQQAPTGWVRAAVERVAQSIS